MCLVLVPSESLQSTHLPTSEGWTAELTVGLCLVAPTTGFEPTPPYDCNAAKQNILTKCSCAKTANPFTDIVLSMQLGKVDVL